MGTRSRIAIVGCGFFAANHIRAWKDLAEAQLVGVCDLDPERAQAAAQLAGAPAFTDAATMIEAVDPDGIDIITTAHSHLSLARLCAHFGASAIIQKPLASNLAEAMAIADLAARERIRFMVHENFRFQKPIREVKSILASGVIGVPHYASIRFRCGFDVFAGQPYMRTDERLVLMDVGVHVFDVARFLLGEIAELSCRTQRVRPDVRGEDMASALVGFTSGAMGMVEASYSSFLAEDPFPETLIAIEGTHGSVILDRGYWISIRAGEELQRFCAEPPGPKWGTRPWHVVQDSVVETCRHWLASAARGIEPETTVSDNVKTLAVVDACYASAAALGATIRPTDRLAAARRKIETMPQDTARASTPTKG